MRKLPLVSALVAAAALAALTLAVTALAGSSSSSAATVSVTAGKPAEFALTLSKKSVPKGAVTFKVTNKGTVDHDFKIAGKKVPHLSAGKSATLKVTFAKAGKYAYLCTLPGHAAGGMKGVLVVK